MAAFLISASACPSAPPPQAPQRVVVLPPPPPPACGDVVVEDHSVPPADFRATLVRDAMRQKLAAVQACERPYRVRVNIVVAQVGDGRLRAELRAVIYRKTGEMVGDLPTKLSSEHAVPEERATKEAELLKAGGDSTALLFAEHFK